MKLKTYSNRDYPEGGREERQTERKGRHGQGLSVSGEEGQNDHLAFSKPDDKNYKYH